MFQIDRGNLDNDVNKHHKSQKRINVMENIASVPSNFQFSRQEALLDVFEDNANSRCFLWCNLSFMELDGSGDARCGCHNPLQHKRTRCQTGRVPKQWHIERRPSLLPHQSRDATFQRH